MSSFNLFKIFLLFYVLCFFFFFFFFFWLWGTQDLSSQIRDWSHIPILEGAVLTAAPPEKSSKYSLHPIFPEFAFPSLVPGSWFTSTHKSASSLDFHELSTILLMVRHFQWLIFCPLPLGHFLTVEATPACLSFEYLFLKFNWLCSSCLLTEKFPGPSIRRLPTSLLSPASSLHSGVF